LYGTRAYIFGFLVEPKYAVLPIEQFKWAVMIWQNSSALALAATTGKERVSATSKGRDKVKKSQRDFYEYS